MEFLLFPSRQSEMNFHFETLYMISPKRFEINFYTYIPLATLLIVYPTYIVVTLIS